MAISTHTVISKMIRELQPLQDKTPSKPEVQKHIGHVKLMCELLLESTAEESNATGLHPQKSTSDEEMMRMLQQKSRTAEMTEEEYNVMIKGKGISGTSKDPIKGKLSTTDDQNNYEGANGESIFDF